MIVKDLIVTGDAKVVGDLLFDTSAKSAEKLTTNQRKK